MTRYLSLSVVFTVACASDASLKTFNATPEAQISSHEDGDIVDEGIPFVVRGTVSDSDHGPSDLEATWLVGTDVLCETAPPDGDGATECEATLTADQSDIILEVRDPMDGTASVRVSLEVTPTQAPVAQILSPQDAGVYYSDLKVTFEGVVSDAEDDSDTLVAAWTSDIDGDLDVDVAPNSSGEIAGSTYLSEGDHWIQLTVTDITEKTGTDNVSIRVGPPNSAPECGVTVPEDGAVVSVGELIIFEGWASDVDVPSDWLTVNWSSDKDDEIGESTANSDGSVSFPYSDLSPNTHVVTMTVSDEVGSTCSANVILTVGEPPEIVLTAPTDGDVYNQGELVNFAATVSDNEDRPEDLAVQWESDVDGILNTDSSDSSGELQFNTDALSVGTHTVSLTATDTDDLFATEIVTFEINGLPTAPDIDINPDPAYTTDELTVSISADGTDPEGDALTYTYEWFVDGVLSTESTTSVLPATATSKGQSWRVDVTSSDGTGIGETATAEREITNTPPVLESAALTPLESTTVDDLVCTAGFTSDADEDSVTVRTVWSINGVESAVTDETLSASETISGDVIACTMIPNDDEEDGEPAVSESIVIGNSVPLVETVSIEPNPAYAGEELTCTYSGYFDPDDPEGVLDVSTYAWQVDGVDAGTGPVLSGDFIRDNEVVCTVTPSDGTAEGEPVSASLVLSNTAPSIELVSITPDPATVADDLLCSWAGFEDADDDAEATTLQWFINGVDAGSDPILETGFVGGDIVSCTVTPADDLDVGEALTAFLTLDNTAPLVEEIAITPSTEVGTSTSLVCTATATDADGEEPSLTFAWNNLTTGLEMGEGETLTLTPDTSSPGDEVACTATATDGFGDSHELSASVNVGNADPEITSISITPSEGIDTSTTLRCEASATDPDGDEPTIEYAWSNSNTGERLGETDILVLTPEIAQPTHTVVCTATATDADGGIVSDDASVEVDNTAPELGSVIITPNEGIDTRTSLTCAAEATDADGDTPTVTYVWANETAGTSLGSGDTVVLTTSSSSPGDAISCTATATDAEGETDTGSTTVAVENTAPQITSVSVSPSSGITTSTTLTCTAIATDEDGDAPALSYVWSNERTGDTLGTGTDITLSALSSAPGDAIVCTATATDPEGDTDSGSDAVEVENTNPVVTAVTISPSTGIDTATTLRCEATATDADGGEPSIAYAWSNASTGSELGTGSELILTPDISSPADTIVCTATATDSDGGTDSDSAAVEVENTAPEVTSVSITPSTDIDTSTSLVCEASATDADGDAVTISYAWTNDATGDVLGTGSELGLSPLNSSPGDTLRCTATATDTYGDTDAADATVEVENTNPEVTSVSIVPSTGVNSSTPLTCTATATDPDGGEPELSYVWTNDTLGDILGTDNVVDLDPAYAQPGDTISCTATATDADGGTDSSSDSIDVENTNPVVTSVTITPSTGVDTATTLVCDATATDDDGDEPTFEFAWSNGSTGVDLGSGAEITLTLLDSTPGDRIVCTVTATDEEGGTDSASTDVEVENTRPEISSVTITPNSDVDTSTTLVCEATATDPDGDPPTISYQWSNVDAGTTLGSGSELTLSPLNSSPGDTIVCAAMAMDEDGGIDEAEASVSVDNTNPDITSVSIVPSTGVSSSTSLTCRATASDADGDEPTFGYVWTNETLGDTLGTDSVLDLDPAYAQPGDTIVCTVTASDEDGGTDSASDSITVENTNPLVTSVTITPSTGVDTATTLTCEATASDDDGDTPTISYAWTNETEEVSLGEGSDVRLTADTSSPGDSIVCTATALDEDGGEDSDSTAVTIDNTAPEIDSIVVTPNTGVTTDTALTCTVEASDADGDEPVITYVWTNEDEGTELGTASTLTLTPSTSSPGDTITCTATATDSDGDAATADEAVGVENTGPEMGDVEISPSTDVNTATTLTCTATATDADGDTPTITYVWTNETEGSSLGEGSTVTLSATNSSPGDSITCTVTATDADGGEAEGTDSVEVENTQPEISSVTITPSTGVSTATTLSCNAEATDADGDTPSFAYEWSNGAGSILGRDSRLVLTASISSPGETITCTATATDADGGSDTGSDSVDVENTAPELGTVTITPSTGVDTSTTLACSATATDADGDEPTVTYAWTNDSEGISLGSGSSVTLTTTNSSPGDAITCTALATDADGGLDSATASVSVDNSVPVITDVSITPSTGVDTSTTLTCSATATDADGDEPTLTYAWTNDTEGSSLGSGTTVSLTTANSSPGDTIVCTVTATDADGGTASDTASVDVENTAPQITAVTVTPSTSVYSTTSLTCTVTATDADGDTPTITYVWTNDTLGDTLGTESTVNLDPSYANPGDTITCTATASDSDGGTDEGSASVEVENTNPVVTGVTITPSTGVDTSTTLTCSATATDDDGDDATFSYAWTNSTDGSDLGTGSELELAATISSPGDTITCTATATDPDGGEDTDSAAVTVENTDPELTTVAITPDTGVDTSTTLSCTVVATDEDGDEPTIAYAWTNTTEGTSLGTASTVSLSATTTSPGDTITCTATATDSDGGSATASDAVTVENTEPEITSVSISPNTGVTNTTALTCSAEASDDDGDTPSLSYGWTNASRSTTLGTGTTLTLTSSMVTAGESVQCKVTATDEEGASVTDSATVDVENAAPDIDSVTLSPDDVYTNDTITATVSTSDDDGDTVTVGYAWYVDGVEVAETGSTLSGASYFDKDQEVYVVVTPSDDESSGDAATSDAVTILNTAPTEPGVNIAISKCETGWTAMPDEESCVKAFAEYPDGEYWADAESHCNSLGGHLAHPRNDAENELLHTVMTAASASWSSAWIGYNDRSSEGNWVWSDGTSGSYESWEDSTSQPNGGTTENCAVIRPDGGWDDKRCAGRVYKLDYVCEVDVSTEGPLVCSVDTASTDADGDSISYTIEWDVDGTTFSDASTTTRSGDTVDQDDLSGNETWTCTVTPNDGDEDGDAGSAEYETENTQPEITSVTITPSTGVGSSTSLTCSATGTDADDETLSYSYAWTNATTGDSLGSGASVTLDPSDAQPGETITCTATVEDEHDGSASDSASVTVENTDPEITSVSISPDSDIDNSTTLTCTGAGSDADEDDVDLSYSWTNASEGSSLGSGRTVTLSTTTASSGDTIRCTVTGTDPDGGTDTGSASVEVGNAAPEVTSVTLSPDDVYTNDTITATVSTSDDDDDSVTVSYAWYVDGSLVGETGSTLSGVSYFDKDEDVYVVVTPSDGTDSGDAETSDSVTILNTEPEAPEVSITNRGEGGTCMSLEFDGSNDVVTMSTNRVPEGNAARTVTVWAKVESDASNLYSFGSGAFYDRMSILFGYPSGGQFGVTNGTPVFLNAGSSAAYLSTWTHYAVTYDETTLKLYANGELIASTTGMSFNTVNPGSLVLGANPWRSAEFLDGRLSDMRVWTRAFTEAEVNSDKAAVSPDETGLIGHWLMSEGFGTNVWNSSVGGATGSISGATWVGDCPSIRYGGLLCSVDTDATDADGDSISYTYEWTVDGETYSEASTTSEAGDTVNYTALGANESWVCTVTPNDGDDDGDAGSADYTTENNDPVILGIAISPDTGVTTSTSLTCEADAEDEDGDEITLSYAWTNARTGSTLSSSSSLELDPSDVNPGDGVLCTVTATDAYDGTSSDSASVEIENTAPEVSGISISPSTGVTNSSDLTCSASASDDDGDTPTLTYAWTNVSESSSLGTGSTLSLTTSTASPGDTIRCTATATDSEGETDSTSTTVDVDNTAPEISSVSLSPSSVYTDDTITASVSSSDDDGDTVTVSYAWYVDGSLVGETGSTLSGETYFDKDEEVYVEVTPSDGTEDGDSVASDTITISNTAPTAPEVSVENGVEDCGYVELDGDDGFIFVNAPSEDLLSETEGWTVEGWFRVDDPGDGIDETGTGGFGDRLFGTSCTYNDVTLTSSGTLNYFRWGTWCYGSTSISDGEFHHIAAVTENGEGTNTFRLFVDGKEDCSATADDMSSSYDNEQFFIGANLRGGGACDSWGSTPRAVNNMDGAVGAFRISTGVRYTDDFEPDATFDADSSTVVVYDFGEGSGSTTSDDSDSGVDGTLYGDASWGDDCEDYGNMVCSIDTESTDADGDAISYSFAWDVDGEDYTDATTTTETGDTVDEDDVGYSETWTCEVTASDGEDESDVGSGSVTTDACDDGSSESCPATDCQQIMDAGDSEGDGTYWIDPDGSGAFEAYCDMTTDGGGWTRIVDYDFSEDDCPDAWRADDDLCHRPACGSSGVTWSTYGIEYGEVRGTLSGYQWGDTNGFGAGGSSIESTYVDGFSLQSGLGSGAQHVFTYAVGLTTYSASGFGDRDGNCPDSGGRSPPSFVGGNYACNTTNSGTSYPTSWSSSLVFDEEAFSMDLDSESSEDLTGRIRANECATSEDLGITELTLFVR